MKKSILIAMTGAAVLALASCSSNGTGSGDGYPAGPVSYVVPYSPGGSADPVGREFSKLLFDEIGGSVSVQNLPGGDETIGTSHVAQAAPDGLTIGMASQAGLVFGPLASSDLPYTGPEDFTLLARMIGSPNAIFVAQDSTYQTLDELIDAAKAAPGSINVATVGRLTPPTFNWMFLQKSAGVDFNIVPFNDGAKEAVLAVLSGQVDATIVAASGQVGLIQSGDLRALAHTGDSGYDSVMGGAPTFESLGYEVPFTINYVSIAPAGLPPATADELAETAFQIASGDEWATWASDNGMIAAPLRGDDLDAWLVQVKKDSQRAIELVEASGL